MLNLQNSDSVPSLINIGSVEVHVQVQNRHQSKDVVSAVLQQPLSPMMMVGPLPTLVCVTQPVRTIAF